MARRAAGEVSSLDKPVSEPVEGVYVLPSGGAAPAIETEGEVPHADVPGS